MYMNEKERMNPGRTKNSVALIALLGTGEPLIEYFSINVIE